MSDPFYFKMENLAQQRVTQYLGTQCFYTGLPFDPKRGYFNFTPEHLLPLSLLKKKPLPKIARQFNIYNKNIVPCLAGINKLVGSLPLKLKFGFKERLRNRIQEKPDYYNESTCHLGTMAKDEFHKILREHKINPVFAGGVYGIKGLTFKGIQVISPEYFSLLSDVEKYLIELAFTKLPIHKEPFCISLIKPDHVPNCPANWTEENYSSVIKKFHLNHILTAHLHRKNKENSSDLRHYSIYETHDDYVNAMIQYLTEVLDIKITTKKQLVHA